MAGPNGYDLAYVYTNNGDGKNPTVVFLGGFRSDMAGTKALFLENLA
ncbi:MAG TPA: alpha/beta hydrolase, partial [Rhodospirillaceae bacterium]|nr:alpha/beta hydrolase [Rhodospirillaceae bacterium]